MVLFGKFSQPYSQYPVRAQTSGEAIYPYCQQIDWTRMCCPPVTVADFDVTTEIAPVCAAKLSSDNTKAATSQLILRPAKSCRHKVQDKSQHMKYEVGRLSANSIKARTNEKWLSTIMSRNVGYIRLDCSVVIRIF